MPKLKPTKENQKAWVKQHLNNGELPDDEDEYWEDSVSYTNSACYESLVWLESARPHICTLEQAWSRCPRPDWLVWCLIQMKPTKTDVKRVLKATRTILAKLTKNKGDREFFEVSDGILEDYIDLYRHVAQNVVKGRSADRLWQLMEIIHNVFDFQCAEDYHKNPNRRARKYADIIRQNVPNPWVRK